jgi:MIP family channel proteins
MNQPLLKQCVAEFIGTFALIFVGIGAIHNNLPTAGVGLLGVALAHGLTIAVMVTATGAISGGQLNPAVTFGLLIGGQMNLKKSVAYWVAQLAGATVAGLLCAQLLGVDAVKDGTPDIDPTMAVDAAGNVHLIVSTTKAIVIEAVLTFFLVFVVYGSAVDVHAPKIGGLAIGLTVALDILFGGPLTGAAMNPARTFGPALASGHWNNHMVYWIGPMLGGALAGLIYGRFLIRESK